MIDSPSLLSQLVQIIQPLPLSSGIRASGAAIRPEPSRPQAPAPADRVEISSAARRAEARVALEEPGRGHIRGTREFPTSRQLSPGDDRLVQELRRRDQQVRAHENAHKSAGGEHAGAVTFRFRTGPDGKLYAVGGSVSIDTSPVEGDPRATIAKMQKVKRAALAPADPSPRDRLIASRAEQILQEARQNLGRIEGDADSSVGPSLATLVDTYA